MSVMELLKGFTNVYTGFSSFSEIFSPILLLLHKILLVDNYPKLLIANTKEVIQLIEKQVNECQMLRQPLQMRKKKPVPIKLLTPKFEEKYVRLFIFLLSLQVSTPAEICYCFFP